MKTLTTATLDQMTTSPEWEGFGYLGERQRALSPSQRVAADAVVIDYANERGLTEDQLFDWANSKDGRWFGDLAVCDQLDRARALLPR